MNNLNKGDFVISKINNLMFGGTIIMVVLKPDKTKEYAVETLFGTIERIGEKEIIIN